MSTLETAIARVAPSRQAIFDSLWNEVAHAIRVQPVPSAVMQGTSRGWAWDARAMPSGSHYDPVYIRLLAHLEAAGEIDPDRSLLVETTTGSAGASFARVAAALGYQSVVFMPEDLPGARIAVVREQVHTVSGSELRLSPAGEYVGGLVRALRRFLAETRGGGYLGKEVFAVDHSRRAEAVDAIHEIGVLVLDALPPEVNVECALLALGNGTSYTGLGRALMERFPECKLVGVEPQESAWFYHTLRGADAYRRRFGAEPGPRSHGLIGTGGWGVDFPNMDLSMLTDIYPVSESEWRFALQQMEASRCYVGHSTAACVASARSLVERRGEPPSTFFTVYYDSIYRYGS